MASDNLMSVWSAVLKKIMKKNSMLFYEFYGAYGGGFSFPGYLWAPAF